MRKTKLNQKGITLISLVITIIVLLILAGVGISMAINADGLFKKANEAKTKWNERVNEEQNIMDEMLGYLEDQLSAETPPIYAKLYTDGTLIFSSTDYTDGEKTIAEPYGDISKEHYYVRSLETDEEVLHLPGWFDTEEFTCKATNIVIYDKIHPKYTAFWFEGYSGTSLDLSNLDTSNVTDMNSMFFRCTGLTTLVLGEFDTSNVTDMSCMFSGCYALNDYSFLNRLNVDKVLNFKDILSGNIGTLFPFGELDVSTWNISLNANVFAFFQNSGQKITLYVKNTSIKQLIESDKSNAVLCVVK